MGGREGATYSYSCADMCQHFVDKICMLATVARQACKDSPTVGAGLSASFVFCCSEACAVERCPHCLVWALDAQLSTPERCRPGIRLLVLLNTTTTTGGAAPLWR
jgi:hypothetical protein